MPNRRRFLISGAVTVLAGATGLSRIRVAPAAESGISHSDAEWRKLLSPAQYDVLRQAGTEPPFTSPLLHEKRAGMFACAGCDLADFSSKTKFDSGTGWPSFWAPIDGTVKESSDASFGMDRTAISCRRCNSHLGHVFNDGPPPTGLRYCMNGLALKFSPNAA